MYLGKTMKRLKFEIIIGLVLLISGTGLLIGIAHSLDVNAGISPTIQTTFVTPLSGQPSVKIQGEPAELIIPSLDLDLKIIPGYYNTITQTWTLSPDKVQYATITPPPNNIEGNTFLYGHDLITVFASLHTIKANSLAIVKTDNDHTFYYQLNNILTTNPLDDSVFNYHGKPILTIQTCGGWFYQDRQFFIFNLERVE